MSLPRTAPRPLWFVLLLVVAATACARNPSTLNNPDSGGNRQVRLQLKWVTQAQFAGYYAAAELGFYKKEGLDVQLLQGGPDITPEQVVNNGGAEFGLNFLPSLLTSREQGMDLVNIAQVFERSGLLEVQWKDSGIKTLPDLKGKQVGVWCCGNQYEVFAALWKNGLEPNKDVTIVDQPFDMHQLLSRQVDSAAAMTYNELAQMLEQQDPKTGRLFTLDQLNTISMEQAGTGMLEDGIFVRSDWIKSTKNQDTAKKFLRASFLGWMYCRDHQVECVQFVIKNGSSLGFGHQAWQMNEINALAWPAAPNGIGVMDAAAFQRTAAIARDFGVIKHDPDPTAFRTDLAEAAVRSLKDSGQDVFGKSFRKSPVQISPGGK